MKKTKTISEVDRRLLQSGKHLFSCNTGKVSVSEKILALSVLFVIGSMIL